MAAQADDFSNMSRADLIRQIMQLVAEVQRLRRRTIDDMVREMIDEKVGR